MQPVHWRWSDLAPLLDRVGRSVSLAPGGNRRTLRLTNPGLEFGTTPTFWGSIQYILPGEVATAHRHAATALRFIMQGEGAWTNVNGEHYAMNEGDLVLTPPGTWHDHTHHGDAPMIWLDVLDISLVRSMHATFFEAAPTPVQPISNQPSKSAQLYGSGLMRPAGARMDGGGNPLLTYSASQSGPALRAAAQLGPDRFGATSLEFQNPLTGGPALTTIGTELQWLHPGARGIARRHTGSLLNYVVRGHGTTVVDGVSYGWSPGDFVAIPPWTWYEHSLTERDTEAALFQVNDLPAMRALGMYREEDHPGDGHQALKPSRTTAA